SGGRACHRSGRPRQRRGHGHPGLEHRLPAFRRAHADFGHRPGGIMRLFRENLALKLASLALAIGVWFYVRGQERPVQIVSVPLEVRNLPVGLALAGDVIDSVTVRLKAPEVILDTMSPEKISARLDLSNLEPGDHLVRLK